MKKLEQQDIDKAVYYVEVAAKFYSTTYNQIKDLAEDNKLKLSVLKLAELIQKECLLAQKEVLDLYDLNLNKSWFDKVFNWWKNIEINIVQSHIDYRNSKNNLK